jgi:thiol-disulfide isomerase/thioredoxin
MEMKMEKLTSHSFNEKVYNLKNNVFVADKPVIIKFFVENCSGCKIMEEAYNNISETLKEKAYFYEMKAGSDKEVINRYRINELPSFLCIYKDKFSKNEGIFPEEVLEELIDNFLTLVKGS